MSRDVGKGLDPKRETSCTAGDKSCRGRQDMPRETRHTAGGGTYRRRRVGSRRHGKTGWGKGVPLTIPREMYCHHKCDHCELYGHLCYDCPAYTCPICHENCGKKPKNCPCIIPPPNTEVQVVDVPPPYFLPQQQDGRQTPFHNNVLDNPMPIADQV